MTDLGITIGRGQLHVRRRMSVGERVCSTYQRLTFLCIYYAIPGSHPHDIEFKSRSLNFAFAVGP